MTMRLAVLVCQLVDEALNVCPDLRRLLVIRAEFAVVENPSLCARPPGPLRRLDRLEPDDVTGDACAAKPEGEGEGEG